MATSQVKERGPERLREAQCGLKGEGVQFFKKKET